MSLARRMMRWKGGLATVWEKCRSGGLAAGWHCQKNIPGEGCDPGEGWDFETICASADCPRHQKRIRGVGCGFEKV